MTCYAVDVPATDRTAFENSYVAYVTLRVPAGSVEAYATTVPWSGFKQVVAIPDTDVPPVEKCATPAIILDGGKVTFACGTPDVQYHYEITRSGTVGTPGELDFTSTYTLSVYATKEGYADSDVATVDITLSRGSNGDVNGDGTVGIGDIVAITNIMAGIKE